MNKFLTLRKCLKINNIFLIPLFFLILGLIYTNNLNLNIKNISETYFYVIFTILFFPIVFLLIRRTGHQKHRGATQFRQRQVSVLCNGVHWGGRPRVQGLADWAVCFRERSAWRICPQLLGYALAARCEARDPACR